MHGNQNPSPSPGAPVVTPCPHCHALVLAAPTLIATIHLNPVTGEGRWTLEEGTARFTGKGFYTNHATTCSVGV